MPIKRKPRPRFRGAGLSGLYLLLPLGVKPAGSRTPRVNAIEVVALVALRLRSWCVAAWNSWLRECNGRDGAVKLSKAKTGLGAVEKQKRGWGLGAGAHVWDLLVAIFRMTSVGDQLLPLWERACSRSVPPIADRFD